MLVQLPPMGWNSWNTFGRNINEDMIKEMADAIVDRGLKDVGYEYVVIDDCWSEMERDPVTHKLVPSKEKFPHGMKALSDYVHSKGLKFGMYSCTGVKTCAGYPGSFDHEFLDAKTFAEWGVDFLKYDNCYKPNTADGPLLYRRMGHALRASGRDILFSACNWGSDNVWSFIRSTGAHMYRSTGDIFDNFASFKDIFQSQTPQYPGLDLRKPEGTMDELAKHLRSIGGTIAHAPNCFNDLDMLTVGMFGKGNVGTTGCDKTDYKTQFALWCLFGAPLMLGADIRSLDEEMLKLLTNKGLLEINQDPECRGVFLTSRAASCNADHNVYARLLANGDIAIGFFNLSENEASPTLFFESMGIPFSSGMDLHFVNAITGEDLGTHRELYKVHLVKHDCLIVRATPVWR